MREAIKLAIEWIEKQPEETPDSKYDVDTRYVVIREIEAALAQLEQDQDEVDIRSRLYQRIHELETQLAQPEQRPVAWRFQSAVGGWAYGKEPPIGSKYAVEPLYTTPPKRKPLTDEEMKKIWYAMQNIMGWYSFQEIARAIEAAHGIKE